MDSRNIAKGFLSLTAPGILSWSEQERPDFAGRVNDYTASLVAKSPRWFGHFATLPLPDIDAALQELSYALDDLHADGLVLLQTTATNISEIHRLNLSGPSWTGEKRLSIFILAKQACRTLPAFPHLLLTFRLQQHERQ